MPPPSPPPGLPGANYKPTVETQFTLAGTVETFDKPAFVSDLSAQFPTADVSATVSSGSVAVNARMIFATMGGALSAAEAIDTAIATNNFGFITSATVDSATSNVVAS
jgi:hypothetical protein